MELILVRHGESEGNVEDRLQGQLEYPLTEKGVHQAKVTARRLLDHPVTAIYSSSVGRALATAEIIGKALSIPVLIESALKEYDFGSLSGLTWSEVRKRDSIEVASSDSGQIEYPSYPGEEGRQVFRERVCNGLWAIANKHLSDERVIAITHAGPITVFAQDVLGRIYRRPNPFQVNNCSLTTIEFRGADLPFGHPRAALLRMNDSCHLT